MAPIRIGMITLCYKPVVNGVVRMIDQYRDHLTALGHEVTLFTFSNRPNCEEEDVVTSFGVPVINSGYYAAGRFDQKAQHRLQEMDILHSHHLFMTHSLVRPFTHCPIVYTNHTRYDLYAKVYLPLPSRWVDKLMGQVWPRQCESVDAVIAPSESVAQVMRHFGVQKPIELIENGIDLRPFHTPSAPLSKMSLGLPPTAVLFTYVGRLSYEKRVDILLKQFERTALLVPASHLMIIGDGPTMPQLRRMAKRSKCANRIHFQGNVGHNEIPNFLAASDIFVTASKSEVHPLTFIEALAAGLPIIAPDAPGNYDIISDGKSGFLVKEFPDGLAQKMITLVSQPELRNKMSLQARQESDRYNINHTIAKTVALYEKLLAEKAIITPSFLVK